MKQVPYLDVLKKNSSVVIFLAAFFMLSGIIIGTFFQAKESGAKTERVFHLKEVNLVSSVEGAAPFVDDKLTDAWGLEFGHTGRVWLNTNSGFSTVHDGSGKTILVDDANGQKVPLKVKIPSSSSSPDEAAPLTGMVFSENNDFSNDSFVFVTEQGTIAGWNKLPDGFHPLEATMRVDNSARGAVYKGVTSAKTDKGWLLYVANFGQASIDVFNTKYEPVVSTGAFKDRDMPKDYAPFNIKKIKNELYVTYAKQGIDKANDVKGLGNGYIDVFDFNGKLVRRFASTGNLNSPWGLALAPENFGELSNYLLVGNFGDGHINVYDLETGDNIGVIEGEDSEPLQIDGLWALTFGTDNGAGKKNELFFAAGPSAEDQGIYGKLDLVD